MSLLDGYLNEQQLAEQLKRKASTLERWRRLRVGPAFIRLGKSPIYSVAAVQDWLRSGGVQPRSSRGARRTA